MSAPWARRVVLRSDFVNGSRKLPVDVTLA